MHLSQRFLDIIASTPSELTRTKTTNSYYTSRQWYTVKYVWKPTDNLTIVILCKDNRRKPEDELNLEISKVVVQQSKFMGYLNSENIYDNELTDENITVIRDLITPVYAGASEWTELPTVDEGKNRW